MTDRLPWPQTKTGSLGSPRNKHFASSFQSRKDISVCSTFSFLLFYFFTPIHCQALHPKETKIGLRKTTRTLWIELIPQRCPEPLQILQRHSVALKNLHEQCKAETSNRQQEIYGSFFLSDHTQPRHCTWFWKHYSSAQKSFRTEKALGTNPALVRWISLSEIVNTVPYHEPYSRTCSSFCFSKNSQLKESGRMNLQTWQCLQSSLKDCDCSSCWIRRVVLSMPCGIIIPYVWIMIQIHKALQVCTIWSDK